MAWKLTIAGVTKTTSIHQPSGATVDLKLNDRGTATFRCLPGFLPNRFDETVIFAQDGVTKLFGGVVMKRTQTAFGHPASNSFYTDIDCTDWWTYADWCFSSRVYSTSVTLKQVLTDLVSDCLGVYGITLDAGQVTGPTLPAFAWNNTKVSDALRSLSTSTGGQYVVRIDASKALKMFIVGTDPAPFTMTDASPHCTSFLWADSDFTPATKVILSCGPSGVNPYFQTWVQSGGATSWVADIPVAAGTSPPGYVTVNGIFKTVGPGANYTWDPPTKTLTLGTDTLPTNGWLIQLVYIAQYPFTVIADAGTSPPISYLASDVSIITFADGTTEAAGLLASLNQQPRVAVAVSLSIGWLPGQALTVALTHRSVTATFSITEVSIQLISDAFWRYTLTSTENAIYQGSTLDQWRQILSNSGGTAPALVGGGGGITTTLSSPITLGGSREVSQNLTPKAWVKVPSYIPYTAPATFSGRIRVDLFARHAAIGCTARLWDETAGAAVATTSLVTSQTAVSVTAVGSITAGHVYHLEIESDTDGEGVYGIGTLEAA